jgi:peptide methionine sulfoxide reductase msrA/msrB
MNRMSITSRMALMLLLASAVALGASCTKSGANPDGSAKSAEQPSARDKQAQAATKQPAKGLQTAILAGGCFWGMEDLLRKVPGVVDTVVGYTGGTVAEPSYSDVKTGASGHAESVKVVFDPAKLSYADLLEKWFFRMHDPTTRDRQGNDVGSQYRSAIFVSTPEQRKTAEKVIERMNASGKWDKPIVTRIEKAGPFTPAEAYHQDYLQKHPDGYTCHFLRDWEDT